MAAFSQFESELDEQTRNFLNRGARLTQLLIQKKNQPYSLAEEVTLIWAGNSSYLDSLPLTKIPEFESQLLRLLNLEGRQLIKNIAKNKTLEKDDEKKLEELVKKTVQLIQ